jgi:NADH dehydrogenase
VGDLAEIAVGVAQETGSRTLDALGPETFSYEAFLRLIASELERKVIFAHTPPALGILLGKLIGVWVRDVVLTNDELKGLMANKLTSRQIPNGKTHFSAWLRDHKDVLGCQYTSELQRHFH